MVIRVLRQFHPGHPVVERRRPLVRLAADEAVEFVEPAAGRPAVGGTGGTDLPGRRLVAFAECRRAVPIVAEHRGQRRDAGGALAGGAGKGGGHFHHQGGVAGVVIAPGEQGGPRRRTDPGGVEVVVDEALPGEPVQGRHVDGAPERGGLAETHVVDEDDEDVGSAGGRLDLERGWGRGSTGVQHGAVRVIGFRDGQGGPVGCGLRLRLRRSGQRHPQQQQ